VAVKELLDNELNAPVLGVVPPIAGGLAKLNVPPSVKLPELVTEPVNVNPLTVPVPDTDVTVPVGIDGLLVKSAYEPLVATVARLEVFALVLTAVST
jgi:hypothetical protein